MICWGWHLPPNHTAHGWQVSLTLTQVILLFVPCVTYWGKFQFHHYTGIEGKWKEGYISQEQKVSGTGGQGKSRRVAESQPAGMAVTRQEQRLREQLVQEASVTPSFYLE